MSGAAPFDVEAAARDLVDHAAIAKAEAVLREAEEKRDAMVKRAAEAARRAAEVRNQWPLMVETAAAGAVPSLDEVMAVYREGEAADRYAGFLGTVARRLEEPVEAAKLALADVLHEAWWPAFRRGQDMRIAAARKLDQTKGIGPRGTSAGETAERERLRAAFLGDAEQRWHNGNDLLRLAWQRGVRFRTTANFSLVWPQTTETDEREYWGRGWIEELTDGTA